MTIEHFAEWERQDKEEGPAVWAEILEQLKEDKKNDTTTNTK